jgi:hypothetical protein
MHLSKKGVEGTRYIAKRNFQNSSVLSENNLLLVLIFSKASQALFSFVIFSNKCTIRVLTGVNPYPANVDNSVS